MIGQEYSRRSANEDSPGWTSERGNYMLGDIVRLANNLWLVAGDITVDVPNVLLYLAHDRLYLMDSAAGLSDGLFYLLLFF